MKKKKRKFLCFVLKILIMLVTLLDLITDLLNKLFS